MQLRNKKILLGVCGSIAAYKVAHLVRLLITAEAEVKVVMTASASAFITPLTLATLSKNPVATSFVQNEQGEWTNHVELGLWADHILIAPASANTIAKMAHGICDNLLCAVILSARCPVSVAPAMDLDMLAHATTQQNLSKIQSMSYHILATGYGELASGLVGQGRMAEPEELLQHLTDAFVSKNLLADKKILITAGPTQEAIDPVRFVSNHSTGKMGYALAEAAAAMGALVTLVSGPVNIVALHPNIKLVKVQSAAQMYNQANAYFTQCDVAILAAAVADYTPKYVATEKIKKNDGEFVLEFEKTIDIAYQLGKQKLPHQVIVGFALETNNEIAHAKAKIERKNFDFIVLNSLQDAGAGFAHDTNKISIIGADGSMEVFALKSKKEVAKDILTNVSIRLESKK